PQKHILRKLKDVIDFSQVHEWVAPLYSEKTGRPSIDPELVVRIIVLEYLFNHSEREFFSILPMHAGYLWFCGLDFESSLPDRTTLVKTRALWRQHGVFDRLMHQVVDQCIAAGLVKPDVHAGVDGTQVRANASIHSLQEKTLAPVQSLQDYLSELERDDRKASSERHDNQDDDNDRDPTSGSPSNQEKPKTNGLEERAAHENFRGKKFSNQTYRSVTDPDARLYRKSKGQETYLRYLVHNLMDVESGVILATTASVASGTAEREVSLHQLAEVRFKHKPIKIRTLSADKAYGTPFYLQSLFSQGITPLVSLQNLKLEETPTWKRKTNDPERQRKRQAKVEEVRIKNKAKQIQLDGKYREIQVKRTRLEHGYAESKNVHGLERARSRGLDCMQEQALCTAIVQNLKRLCRLKGRRPNTGTLACAKTKNPREWSHQYPLAFSIFSKIYEHIVQITEKFTRFSPVF
ncbi:transposase, partial [Melghirimyces profundicolus]